MITIDIRFIKVIFKIILFIFLTYTILTFATLKKLDMGLSQPGAPVFSNEDSVEVTN
jgi:hypothetical protein